MQPYLFTLPSYSLMIILALVVVNVIAFFTVRTQSLGYDDFVLLECWMVLGALTGSKLLYFLTVFSEIDFSRLREPEYLSLLLNSGFVFYGGVLGALLFLPLGGRVHKIRVAPYLDTLCFLIPLAHAFGRIGCFLAGCCYGIPYSGPFSVTFPEGSFAPSGVPLLPVQLIEAAGLLLISAALYFLYNREGRKGSLVFYALSYSVLRFTLEFFRGDAERGFLLGLSTSQWISLALFLAALLYLLSAKSDVLKLHHHQQI